MGKSLNPVSYISKVNKVLQKKEMRYLTLLKNLKRLVDECHVTKEFLEKNIGIQHGQLKSLFELKTYSKIKRYHPLNKREWFSLLGKNGPDIPNSIKEEIRARMVKLKRKQREREFDKYYTMYPEERIKASLPPRSNY